MVIALSILGFMALILGAIVVVFDLYKVKSDSMKPSIDVNNRLVVNRFAYAWKQPVRNDVVVLAPEPVFNKVLVHRIVAVGGDHVFVKNNKLYVNNSVIDHADVAEPIPSILHGNGLVLKEEYVFQKGDNSPDFYGIAQVKDILGKVCWVFKHDIVKDNEGGEK